MTIKNIMISASIGLAGLSMAAPAHAGPDPYLGEIMEVGFNFCPRGTADANGQLLPISQYSALFSLYGTFYGGDGRTTFGLPDLRGRVSLHAGTGPGLSTFNTGSKGGVPTTTMTINQMPNHGHNAGMKSVATAPDTPSPAGAALTVQSQNAYSTTTPGPNGAGPRFMNPANIFVEPKGGGQAQTNMQPYLTTRKCIATTGVFPSRN